MTIKTLSESVLNQRLIIQLKVAMPQCVIFKHADRITSGIPDMSLTWSGRTSWIEVKYLKAMIVDRGIQWMTCSRLQQQGQNCWYVVFSAHGANAWIYEPSGLHAGVDVRSFRDPESETCASTRLMTWVADGIRELHMR